MKDPKIKENIERILNLNKDPREIISLIESIIGGLTFVKAKSINGLRRITFFNHSDGYSIKADPKTIEKLCLTAYFEGYRVEAHLSKGFSTKHYAKRFREKAINY